MRLSKEIRSFGYCALFCVLAELGLRSLAPEEETTRLATESERPVALILGTSRSKVSLRPATIEDELAKLGHPDVWAASIWREASSQVGIYFNYRFRVRELLQRSGAKGVVAIEVGAMGMNDSNLSGMERKALDRQDLPPLGAIAADGEADGDVEARESVSFWSHLADGDVDTAARSIFAAPRLFRGRTELADTLERLDQRRREAELAQTAGDEGPSAIDVLATAPWGRDDKGFENAQKERRDDLDVEKWRGVYAGLLADYSLGGVQSEFLRRTIRTLAAEGFEPVLYNMPVSSVHKSFHPPGQYERYVQHVARVAAEEGVPFVDFDADNLGDESFHDTHHLRASEIDPFSRRFADRVLAPALR